MSKRVLFLLVLLTFALAACGGGAATQPAGSGGAAGDATNGQKLFTAGKSPAPPCSSCHSIKPNEKLVGPSLAGIGTQADQIIKDPGYKGKAKTAQDYINESIVDPNAYVTPGFQPGIMYQNYGKDLSSTEVNDLVAYLMTLK
jgi:nitric oxide reductase subunit C